jgi:hypothetical protein
MGSTVHARHRELWHLVANESLRKRNEIAPPLRPSRGSLVQCFQLLLDALALALKRPTVARGPSSAAT